MARIEALESSHPLEREAPPSLYYLGPRTFTEEAAKKAVQIDLLGAETRLIPVSSIPETFSHIKNSQIGIVPIENSTDGHVKDGLQGLSEGNLRIIGEVVTPITQCLYRHPTEEPRIVASKDSALGQSRGWLKDNLPQVPEKAWQAVESTAKAVEMAAQNPQVAAIGPHWSGQKWVEEGKLIRIDNAQDNPHNATRFVLIVPYSHETPPRTGSDKTTLLLTLEDKPGSLYECLKELAERQINLSQIKSFARQKGAVQMLTTLEGHEIDLNVAEALSGLKGHTQHITNFGSYPQAPKLETEGQLYLSFKELVALHREVILDQNGNGKNGHSVVAFTLVDQPGSLMRATEPFADRRINLEGIDSLPSGILDTYLFYLSFDGNHPEGSSAIAQLRDNCVNFIKLN